MITTTAEIKTSEEYSDSELVPPLTDDEYESLKESIKQNGQWVPIVVNKDGIVLDGHHRLTACVQLGINEVKTETKEFSDKLEETLFVIECNLIRRHLNNFQRTELALKSKSILEQIAIKNMSSGGKGVLINTPLDRVNKEIAKRVGVGETTVARVERIVEKAPEEVKQKLRRGEMSINEAFEEIKQGERWKELEDSDDQEEQGSVRSEAYTENTEELGPGSPHVERPDAPEEIYNVTMDAYGRIWNSLFDCGLPGTKESIEPKVAQSQNYRLRLLKGLPRAERNALISQTSYLHIALVGFLKHAQRVLDEETSNEFREGIR